MSEEKPAKKEKPSQRDKVRKRAEYILALWSQERLVSEIEQTVVGQHEAVEKACAFVLAAIRRCVLLLSDTDASLLPRGNAMLLTGPTGSGKTYIIETIIKTLGLCYYTINGAFLTGSGWRGRSFDDDMKSLAESQREAVAPILVFVDEIDKVGRDDADYPSFNPIKDFLKALEATGPVRYGPENDSSVLLDHDSVFFVFAGAYEGIEKHVKQRLLSQGTSSIGFGSDCSANRLSDDELRQLANGADFEKFGVSPEFLGRIATYASVRTLDKTSFTKILCGGKKSVQGRFNMLMPEHSQFIIDKSAVELICERALKAKRGARGAETMVAEAAMPQINAAWSDSEICSVVLVANENELVCTSVYGDTRREMPSYLKCIDEDSDGFDVAGRDLDGFLVLGEEDDEERYTKSILSEYFYSRKRVCELNIPFTDSLEDNRRLGYYELECTRKWLKRIELFLLGTYDVNPFDFIKREDDAIACAWAILYFTSDKRDSLSEFRLQQELLVGALLWVRDFYPRHDRHFGSVRDFIECAAKDTASFRNTLFLLYRGYDIVDGTPFESENYEFASNAPADFRRHNLLGYYPGYDVREYPLLARLSGFLGLAGDDAPRLAKRLLERIENLTMLSERMPAVTRAMLDAHRDGNDYEPEDVWLEGAGYIVD